MSAKDLDLVLFGATGFTGGLTAAELTRQLAGSGLRWAIAGRNEPELQAVRRRLAALDAEGAPDEVLVADATDRADLRAVTDRAHVAATTVGPFARLGEDLVAACVASGTDYVDITGEPAFVARIIERYHDAAAAKGVRIIPCCGFDSIPHDLGAQLAIEHLPADADITIRAYVSAGGRASGGTLASAIDAMGERTRPSLPRHVPAGGRKVGSVKPSPHRQPAVGGWALPLPTIDPQIVLRSAALDDRYGRSFRYGHFLRTGSLPVAAAIAAGVGTAAAVAQVGPGRARLHRLAPDPGTGPDEETRAAGWFRVTLLGEGGGQRVRVEVKGGDPGYTETSRMLAASARTLAEDRAGLPDRHGVLTPASGLGVALRDRLRAQGMVFTAVAP